MNRNIVIIQQSVCQEKLHNIL